MSLFDENKRGAIIARIGKLDKDAPAAWGRMTCNQAICHMTDQLRGALYDLPWEDERNILKKTLVKWLALYAMPKIPKNIPTMPEVDQDIDGTRPTEFENDRALLISYVKKFAAAEENFKWQPHPAFGKMSRKQWDIIAHKHIDHHLRQFGV